MPGVDNPTCRVVSPNPQGKGQNETLSLLTRRDNDSDLPGVNEDGLRRIVTDYLSSIFVLSCDFKFKPVPEKNYYIYSHSHKMILSLIHPEEGGERIFDAVVGRCRLNRDMSWTVQEVGDGEITVDLDIDGSGAELDKVRTILRSIQEIDHWRNDSTRSFYQNAMSYLLLKTLRYRCERLKRSILALSDEERALLDEV